MVAVAQLRQQIEDALAGRGGAKLQLGPRLVCDGFDTGYGMLDAVLRGGLPVAGTSEISGGRSSGRASIAAAYVAERTREGHVCAWVDVAGDYTPEAGLANGMDADRLLVVRCSGGGRETLPGVAGPRYEARKMVLRDKTIGTPGVKNRVLSETARVEQVNSDRQPSRRGGRVVEAAAERVVAPVHAEVVRKTPFARAKKPWTRLEQAIQAVDLLVQGGGFGVIVLDLGGIAPQYARRIPLATWFRWRAALERTRTSLLVLSQTGLAGSSAELALRVEAEMPAEGTVMAGMRYRLEVARRRFAEEDVAGRRKGPGRASAWESRALWA